jgi:FtsH-binding integral membrane protein
MGRAIVTAPRSRAVGSAFPGAAGDSPHTRGMTSPQQEKDTYRERLFKYIPAEVVTLYLFLNTTVAADKSSPRFLYWVIFFAGLIGTPIYLRFAQQVAVPLQLIISTVAFAVWAFALGGPFSEIPGYKPIYGAVLLPIFTFFVASITPATSTQSRS